MMKSRFFGMVFAAVAVLVAGCGSSSVASGEGTMCGGMGAEHESGGMAAMADMCPMKVPGTTVAAADVEGGVALAFTTSTGDVAELRHRVTKMAEMHNQHHAAGGMMPAATASAEETEGGARMVLRPSDPAQLDSLREHARMHADQMSHGACPMMAEGAAHDGHHSPPAE